MERNGRALGWNKTSPKMCLGQLLMASASMPGGGQASLDEKRPAGAGLCTATPNIYSENHLLLHYKNIFSLYLIWSRAHLAR